MDFLARHQQHVKRCAALTGAKADQAGGRKPATDHLVPDADREYSVWAKVIENDVNHLKASYPDHAERAELMPSLIDKYRDYLSAWIASGQTHQNDVLVRCAIWAGDCGQYAYAIDLADHGLNMATGMKRDLPTLLTDVILQAKASTDDDVLLIVERIESGAWVVNHPLMAKVYKWAAKHFEKSDPEKALHFASLAHETYPNVAVKGLKESLEKAVNKQASA